jgi:ribosomal protein S14
MRVENFKKFDLKKMVRKELYKNYVKYFISNNYSILKSDKITKVAYKNFYFYKFSSKSFFRKACIRTGLCRSVFRFFKLSRYYCRLYASNGLFIGVSKASF